MDDLLREFLTETSEAITALDADLVSLESAPDPALLQSIFRLFHTIKGTCGFLGLPRLEALAHAAESVLSRLRDRELAVTPPVIGAVLESIDRIKAILAALEATSAEPAGDDAAFIARLEALDNTDSFVAPAEPAPLAHERRREGEELKSETVRVTVGLLDSLMAMASELVLTRNQLLQLLRSGEGGAFATPLQRLSQVTTELQEAVMKTRMQPIRGAWAKLPRMVRDLARDLGKSIELEMLGGGTELDRQVLELIRDPLTHMVRNAADHGIESPDERARAGKPRAGRIVVSAVHKSGHIVIEIGDDGRGLSLDRIKARALALGLASESELAALPAEQVGRLVLRPGFSTAETVTAISGRGVGLDVVRANIEKLGGTLEIAGVPGQGTRFTIVLPLTLAIVSSLILECAGQRFALPQLSVLELVKAGADFDHPIEYLNRAPVMRLREHLLPLVPLGALMRLEDGALPASALVVVTEVAGRSFGIVVDRVLDVEEIVVKPVAPLLRDVAIFAGATILGDGKVIMILDPAGIAVAASVGAASQEAPQARATAIARDHRMSLLLFRAGAGVKAVPLGVVARLEEVDLAAIEQVGGRPAVQYRGRIMPLVTCTPQQSLDGEGRRPVLVFAHGEAVMGLVVDAIEDIVDEGVAIERTGAAPGLLGSAIVAGKATDIIDAGYYLKHARDDWFASGPQRRRVLLVEDSAFARNLLTPLLAAAGYDVTSVESAEAATALSASGADFDAIVSDGALAPALREGPWRDKPLLTLAEAAPSAGAIQKLDRAALLDGLDRALAQGAAA